MTVAALLVRKHTRKLTTGGVAYQRIVLRLDGKLLVKARHQLHRPCQILKRGVVAQIQEGAVAQHKHSIAQFMQLVGGGAALAHL